MNLLAIDPGSRACGWALFRDSALYRTGTTKPSNVSVGLPVLQSRRVASLIAGVIYNDRFPSDEIAIEYPQIYRAGRSKGDPNDLLLVAAVCGALAMRFPDTPMYHYLPSQWAGRIPKATTKKGAANSIRSQRIRARLSEEEAAVVNWTSHDAIDAIGIGLHHLGRGILQRVRPHAT